MYTRWAAVAALALLSIVPNARAGESAAAPVISNRGLQDILTGIRPVTLNEARQIESVLPRVSETLAGSLPVRFKLAQLKAVEQGLTLYGARIVGGSEAAPTEARWQAALILANHPPQSGQFCGASIVDPNWVVTAAHCVEKTAPTAIRVFAGDRDLRTHAAQVVDVAAITVHPKWNSTSMVGDVALLRLQTPLTLTPGSAEPIALADASPPKAGRLLVVTGWGATSEGGEGSLLLRKVVVPAVPLDECNGPKQYNGGVSEGMLCAGIGGKDSCQGDSGGPLVDSLDAPARRLVGIVSWGQGCAQVNKPGVYTDVTAYAAWIRSEISGH